MSYIIIDDEPLAHETIKEFCNMLPYMHLKKQCYNALEALTFLNSDEVDIIFLDLNMPKLKGFDFLRTLINPPNIIVTTAYSEYALEGFELNVVDYLLKPFSFERLVQAVNKAIPVKPEISLNSSTDKLPNSIRFFLKGDKKYHQINSENILYIEAYGNYTKLYCRDEMIVSHEKISDLINLLPPSNFLRVHKSFIVALDKIKTIEGNRIYIDNFKIPISQTFKNDVSKLYKI
ncbi:response regulator transcription factor [Hyunsoonleella pacifica]|uniref:Response regulator transcription factor n=1 Tax=Hyunsoonleella pacifica TaxID=1080224 RepID=A0A4Q9FLL3_9FLAO|nr:response regulator transcription factor [Hyunsoonleella pacifica]